MGRLIYSMITSLDGYAEAADGDLGRGLRFFPDGVRLDLDLVEQRSFPNGLLYARCTTR